MRSLLLLALFALHAQAQTAAPGGAPAQPGQCPPGSLSEPQNVVASPISYTADLSDSYATELQLNKRVDCTEDGTKYLKCAEIVQEGSTRQLRFYKDAKHEHKRQIVLTAGKQFDLELPRTNNCTSISVHVTFADCKYSFEQLTPMYQGLSGGRVYFRATRFISSPTDTICPEAADGGHWMIQAGGSSSDLFAPQAQVIPNDKVKNILAVNIQRAPTKSDNELKLQFTTIDGTSLSAGVLTLKVEEAPKLMMEAKVQVVVENPANQDIPRLRIPNDWLAVGRDNYITFDAKDLEQWTFTLISPYLQPCPPEPNRYNLRADAKTLSICVRVNAPTADALQLEATYRLPTRERDKIPELEKLEVDVEVGRREISTLMKAAEFRMALNLQDQMHVSCPSTQKLPSVFDPGPVESSAYTGTRAVAYTDLGECTIHINPLHFGEKPSSHRDQSLNTAQVARTYLSEIHQQARELSMPHLAPDDPRLMVLAYLHALGKQRIKLQTELLPARAPATSSTSSGATAASGVISRVEEIELSVEELQEPGGRVELKDDGHLEMKLRIRQNDDADVQEYGIVRITATHANETDYISDNSRSHPKSIMVASLRRMPEAAAYRLPHWLKSMPILTLPPGYGVRGYFTFNLPTGLLRSPNLSMDVTSSTRYERAQSIAFGFGMLGVVEPWDFDQNQALTAFNPQFHCGFFLSELPKADALLPRVSMVVGGGIRIPAGLNNQESPVRLVLWYENSWRLREDWRHALLFGFAVNLGSLPN